MVSKAAERLSRQRKVHPLTYQSVLEISRNIRIHWSSVGRIVDDLSRATNPEENNVPIRLLMYSRVVW